MTILFMDSFDHYDGDTILRKWTERTDADALPSAAQKRTGTQSLYLPKKTIARSMGDIGKTFCVGFGIYRAGSMHRDYNIFELASSNGTVLIALRPLNAASGDAVQGFAAFRSITELVTTEYVWPVATWGYVELRGYLHDTEGWLEIYYDGVLLSREEDIDTQHLALDAATIRFGSINANSFAFYVDDLYFSDGERLGPVNIHARLPNGAGASSGLTPNSEVDNYTCVDDAAPDDDATYVASATPGDKDLYTFGNTPAGSGAIKHVQAVLSASKDGAAARAVHVLVRKGATEVKGETAHRPTNGAYTPMLIEQLPINPITGQAWALVDMDTQFGVQIED